jgi:hypothetical protein
VPIDETGAVGSVHDARDRASRHAEKFGDVAVSQRMRVLAPDDEEKTRNVEIDVDPAFAEPSARDLTAQRRFEE